MILKLGVHNGLEIFIFFFSFIHIKEHHGHVSYYWILLFLTKSYSTYNPNVLLLFSKLLKTGYVLYCECSQEKLTI